MNPRDVLNTIQRFGQGLMLFWQHVGLSPQQQTNLVAQGSPVVYQQRHQLPSGGATNVATNAASYWASMPLLELPETNLGPHYLQDFVLNPPMEAA